MIWNNNNNSNNNKRMVSRNNPYDINISIFLIICLIVGKMERKCKGKKIEIKERRKEKIGEKKNWNKLKLINYFYILF